MSFAFNIYFTMKLIHCEISGLFIHFSEVLLALMISGGNTQI